MLVMLAQTVLERSAEIDEKVRGAATQTVAIYITRDRRKVTNGLSHSSFQRHSILLALYVNNAISF